MIVSYPWETAAVALVIASLCFGMADYPLLDPDEGRNAEVAREMAEDNQYILPRLNGLPYLDKPFLFFAAAGTAMELFGATEFAARLPSLLFTLATMALVGWFGARHLGLRQGLLAAAATGSTPLTLGFARTVIFDATLTTFMVASIVSFYEALTQTDKDRAYLWTVAAWVAIALGVLTKGPIALLLPLLVAVPFALMVKRVGRIINLVGVLSFVAIILPWVYMVSVRIPDFLEYVVVTETWNRLTTDQLGRTGPIWYFLPIIAAGALPWSLVTIPEAVAKVRSGSLGPVQLYALIWIVLPLIFFTLSQSKRPQYVLPMIPAFALFAASAWYRAGTVPWRRTAAVGLIILGAVFATAGGFAGRLFGASSNVAAAIPLTGWLLALTCGACGVAILITQGSPSKLALLCSIPVATIPVIASPLMDRIGRDRSAITVAAAIEDAAPNSRVIAIETYPLSLPFYLERELVLSTSTGAELTSNYLFRTLDRWRTLTDSPLRAVGWWREQIVDCHRPTVFVAKAHDQATRRTLEQALPLLVETRKVAAYGPCGARAFARAP